MTSRPRELLSNLTLAFGSILVLLVGLELGLRAWGYVPPRLLAGARMVDARWRLLLDCYPSNPRRYFEIDLREAGSRDRYFHLAPHRYDQVARRAPYAVEFRYNSLRFRDAPFGPKRPGVRRVIVVGDSFTEGEGVKEPDTTVRVLGRLLNAAEPGRWEVLNCGRRGQDFPALFETFEEVLPFEPDVLLYAMVLNDPVQSEAFHARQTYVDDWILARGHMPDEPEEMPVLHSRLAAFVEERASAHRIGRETTRWYLEMYGEPNRDGWARTRGYIREMGRRVRSQGGEFAVVVWPLFVDLEGHYPFLPVHDAIARFCLQTGIDHHDLLPVFRGRPSPPLWVHPIDRHPNEIAHRLAAQDLVPLVRQLASRR
jgi:hypothetical protein